MRIENSIAIVTGANRGLGRSFAAQLLERGASTVYAAARRPETVDLPGVVPLRLDVTDEEQVAEAARIASDATLVINNAGFSSFARLLDGRMGDILREVDVNYLGALRVVRAFAPNLEANGGGGVSQCLIRDGLARLRAFELLRGFQGCQLGDVERSA